MLKFLSLDTPGSRQRRIDDSQGVFAANEVHIRNPQQSRSFSAGTFIGPGEAAWPGCGCGNAVEHAVWNVMFPSTFCMVW